VRPLASISGTTEVSMVPKLLKFRVTNFRSVEDSGWVEVDDVTALIGTNESGKTNILHYRCGS
jgi:hypothetical protein